MCLWFWGNPLFIFIFSNFVPFFDSVFLGVTWWFVAATPLKFYAKSFKTFQVFSPWSQGVHGMLFGYNPHVNFCQVFCIFHLVFSSLITIRIYNFCVQLLQFSTNYYESLQGLSYMLWRCAFDFGVILPLYLPTFSTSFFFFLVLLSPDVTWSGY